MIYPTLVRMAQEWNLRYPLVDGHGNFGSVDGDPPGAMRYTEAACRPTARRCSTTSTSDTVDFLANYDETRAGADGPPRALPEPALQRRLRHRGRHGDQHAARTTSARWWTPAVLLIEDPEVTLDELMKVIPGPDFPTGGMILGAQGIREAYETGRGSIIMQARAIIEPLDRNRMSIIVTELPYQVNKARWSSRSPSW